MFKYFEEKIEQKLSKSIVLEVVLEFFLGSFVSAFDFSLLIQQGQHFPRFIFNRVESYHICKEGVVESRGLFLTVIESSDSKVVFETHEQIKNSSLRFQEN